MVPSLRVQAVVSTLAHSFIVTFPLSSPRWPASPLVALLLRSSLSLISLRQEPLLEHHLPASGGCARWRTTLTRCVVCPGSGHTRVPWRGCQRQTTGLPECHLCIPSVRLSRRYMSQVRPRPQDPGGAMTASAATSHPAATTTYAPCCHHPRTLLPPPTYPTTTTQPPAGTLPSSDEEGATDTGERGGDGRRQRTVSHPSFTPSGID